MPSDPKILRLQQALKAHYYEPGPLDGIPGKKTLLAAQAFLFEHDLRGVDDPPLTALPPGLLEAVEAAPIWARLIDVSHWQDEKPGDKVGDLSAAKSSGTSAVIIKAGGADSKHGDGIYQDSEYTLYSQQARACQLTQGAYFFHHFSKNPVTQAERFYQIVGSLRSGDLPPALDVEDYKTLIKGKAALDHIVACLVRVEQLFGVRPLLYTSASVLRTHACDFAESPLSAYPLWIPAYGVKSPAKRIPACHKGGWLMWQTGFDDALTGFGNDVDRNFFKGTAEELKTLCVR